MIGCIMTESKVKYKIKQPLKCPEWLLNHDNSPDKPLIKAISGYLIVFLSRKEKKRNT